MALTIEIQNLRFQIYKLPMLKRLVLDRKVGRMMLPVMSSLKGLDMSGILSTIQNAGATQEEVKAAEEALESTMDLSVLLGAVEKALGALDDSEFMALASGLLQVVSCIHPQHGAILLDTEANIDLALGELPPLDVYKLCIEVMRENKFSPFALLAAGSETSETNTSGPQTGNQPASGVPKGSGRSGGLILGQRKSGPTGGQ